MRRRVSVFYTVHQWCDGILRGTRILFLLRVAITMDLPFFPHANSGKRYSRDPGVIAGRSWTALILSGEPAVPGIIPGGVACGLIPGRSGSTLSGEPTVPGKILGGIAARATPAWQLLGRVSSIVLAYTRAGHQLFLLISGQVIDLFIQGGVSYSHHWPHGGESFRWLV